MLMRSERGGDVEAIDRVLSRAFSREPGDRPAEVGLVHELRRSDAWIGSLSVVAEIDDEVVGHCLTTRAHVDETPVLALGPIGVLPTMQRQGIGAALIHETVDVANDRGEQLIGLVGDYEYYRRFGFIPARDVGIESPDPAWGQYFQILKLDSYVPVEGTFRYPEPFASLG